MRRGEVWWAAVEVPSGSRKRRPVLIVSHDAFNKNERYLKVVVVHLTTSVHAGEPFAWEIEVPRGSAGLKQTSIAKCAELYTLHKAILTTQVGTLGAEQMQRVNAALSLALALQVSGA